MSTQVIISCLRECLAKPDLVPAVRRGLEDRLRYWEGKATRPYQDTTQAVKKSARVRRMAASRKYRVVRPMIERLQAEGLMGKDIVAALGKMGVTNLQGKPYGLGGIQYIIRRAR